MNTFVAWLLQVAGWISGHSSRRMRLRFGRMLGTVLRLASRERQRVTVDNIRHAFPEKDASWHEYIMRESYANLGTTLAEFIAIPYLSDKEIASWISFRNGHLIEKYATQKKGMIFLSGHFGNWELGAYGIGLHFNQELTIVVKPLRNTKVDSLTNSYRTRATNKVISMNNAARAMLNALDSGNIVALLADQAADPARDVFVDFFGRQAASYKAPAVLALRSRVPIITGYVVRLADGRYEVELNEIPHDDIENTAEGVVILVQRYVKSLEDAVRQHPTLWSWQHKRWKYNPNDYQKEKTGEHSTYK